MSLLDTVEPDAWRYRAYLTPDYEWERGGYSKNFTFTSFLPTYYRDASALYSRQTVESLIPQCRKEARKEALLEAVEVCKTIANDAEDCGATPEMLEIVYAIEAELRRRAEGETK